MPNDTKTSRPAREKIDLSQVEVSPNAKLILMLAAMVAAICGGLYGYDTGIISGTLPLIGDDFHLNSTMKESVASAILLGAVFGAFVAGSLSEKFGRRTTTCLVSGVFVLGATACAFSPDVWSLIAARFVLGLAVGGSTQVVPMYISELAPRNGGKPCDDVQRGDRPRYSDCQYHRSYTAHELGLAPYGGDCRHTGFPCLCIHVLHAKEPALVC